MSFDPPNQLPDFNFDEAEPLKPGKIYGILAFLCGLQPFFAIPFGLIADPSQNPWHWVAVILVLISPLCAFCGLGFGMLGRNTQGRPYAYIGLLLSLFCCLLLCALLYAFIIGLLFAAAPASSGRCC